VHVWLFPWPTPGRKAAASHPTPELIRRQQHATSQATLLMRGTLRAAGLHELLGGALKGQCYYPKIPKISHLPCHSDNRFSSSA
jgi:hypothetical protein